jgi:dTDP-4-dehydrorhamnose 3,5-epimerase
MDKKLSIEELAIAGVYLIRSSIFGDQRGQFARWFCANELNSILGTKTLCQVNMSLTHHQGSVRGLHFQHPPYCETKLIRCIRGKIWDVAVDLRAGSPTFLKHISIELSADNPTMIVIPEGIAHGFQSLENNSQLLYMHTEFYTPEAESGLNIHDPILNICWPQPITEVSVRDENLENLTSEFTGLTL